MPCKLSMMYVQSSTASPDNPRVASHSVAALEISLPPHKIKVILRVLVAADTELASHWRRPGEKDAHLLWSRV